MLELIWGSIFSSSANKCIALLPFTEGNSNRNLAPAAGDAVNVKHLSVQLSMNHVASTKYSWFILDDSLQRFTWMTLWPWVNKGEKKKSTFPDSGRIENSSILHFISITIAANPSGIPISSCWESKWLAELVEYSFIFHPYVKDNINDYDMSTESRQKQLVYHAFGSLSVMVVYSKVHFSNSLL